MSRGWQETSLGSKAQSKDLERKKDSDNQREWGGRFKRGNGGAKVVGSWFVCGVGSGKASVFIQPWGSCLADHLKVVWFL